MSKLLFVPAVVIMAFAAACNSGADQSKDTAADSSATTTMTDTMHHDMGMTVNEPVPDIPAGAKVYFKNIKNGQTVSSPVKLEFGADGIEVDTAGVITAGKGHHHLLIDAGDSTEAGIVVGKDSTHIHYGKGQKEATIQLTPGKHTLALQFADGIHRSYGGKLSSSVSITVKK
ncbi:MAG: DUF4399 domain-containing protein [Chitinophagaceae bacterium]